MNDIEELLRSATRTVEPDPGALERQHRAQRRRVVRQKVTVYGFVAAIVGAIVLWAVSLSGVTRAPRPGQSSGPPLPSRPIVFQGVFAVNADGSSLTRLTPRLGSTPAWSPDARRIVYASGDVVNGRSRGLFIMDADGSHAHPLTNGDDYLPDWSPDGRRIAFIHHAGYQEQVWVIDVDGSHLRQVTHVNGSLQPGPSWSPDGTQILFSGGPANDAYVVNADGTGHPRDITADHTNPAFQPQWSPDGTRIVFASTSADGWGIYTMAPDGTDVRLLTHSDVGEYPHPVWSPDGRWIAFADKHDPQSPSIEIMTADGRRLTKVVERPGAIQPNW